MRVTTICLIGLLSLGSLAPPPAEARGLKPPSIGAIRGAATPQWVGRQISRPAGHAKDHIGRTPAQLKSDAAKAPSTVGKSSFTDRSTAVRATRQVLLNNARTIERFLKRNWTKPGARLVLPAPHHGAKASIARSGPGQKGLMHVQGRGSVPVFGTKVVIERNPMAKGGYSIQNSYPVGPRSFPRQYQAFEATPVARMRPEFTAKAAPQ